MKKIYNILILDSLKITQVLKTLAKNRRHNVQGEEKLYLIVININDKT